MGQGFQVRHTIEVDLAHQVIELMLDHSRKKAFGCDLDLFSFPIEGINTQLAPSRNTSAKFGNTQATFLIFDQFLIKDRHLRIH